jgi:hypothetical protein
MRQPHLSAIAALALTGLVVATNLLGQTAYAHGDAHDWRAPSAQLTGIERGVRFALSCDHTIHELLAEYDSCLAYYAEQMASDPVAATAYWYVATTRVRSAAQNGYPDAWQFLPVFEARYRQAQGRQVVPESRLCVTIAAPCPAR